MVLLEVRCITRLEKGIASDALRDALSTCIVTCPKRVACRVTVGEVDRAMRSDDRTAACHSVPC
jgi:hypothetical protein